jgi:hypothetical protein
MQDLDNSKADVFVSPVLELHGEDLPDAKDLEGYGIWGNESVLFIPLYPVRQYGNIVALQGQMYYPSVNDPIDHAFDIKMRWRVDGASDKEVNALRAGDDMYVSAVDSGPVKANATIVGDSQTFQWMDLGNEKVALVANNGMYLSMKGDGKITADSVRMTEFERFTVEDAKDDKVALKAYNGKYVKVRTDGSLMAIAGSITNMATFQVIDKGVRAKSTILAYYEEKFALTGCVVEEHHGVDMGVFYHTQDVQQTLAANIYLSYEFMRNASSEVSELPSMLDANDFEMESELRSFDRMDTALEALITNMTKNVRDKFQGTEYLPIITAMKQRGVFAEMSSMGPNSYRLGNTLQVDVTSIPGIEIKTLKTNWYSGSEEQAVEIDEVIETIKGWDLPDEDQAAIVGLVLVWNVGEQIVTKEGDTFKTFSFSEHKDAVHLTKSILKGGIGAFKGLRFTLRLGAAGAAYAMVKVFNILRVFSMANPKSGWATFKTVFSATGNTFKGIWGFINKVNIALIYIGAIIDVAVMIYSFFAIASAYEWSSMGKFIAGLYLGMSAIYTAALLILSLLAFIPYVGIIFAIIAVLIVLSDLIAMIWLSGGWSQYLMELIIDLVTDIRPFAELDMQVLDSDVEISDAEDNGLTVGDRITYRTDSIMWKNTTEANYYNSLSFRTFMSHYIDIHPPWGSRSTVGNSTVWGDLDTDGKTYQGKEVTHEGWIEPGMPMINFPVTIQNSIFYHIYYEECTWAFGWTCETKETQGWVRTDPFTIYFDVMPRTIDDFADWRAITPLDRDGDGINNTDETKTHIWKWDTDGDGLSDGFEPDIGTDPYVYGSDMNNKDTDGDGLADGLEMAGWVVTFQYEGTEFDWHVYSNPLLNDTDSDGLDDHKEFLTRQNPRSKDTNSDGKIDIMQDYTISELDLLRKIDGASSFVQDVAIDDEGYMYVTVDDWFSGVSTVDKYSPAGVRVDSWDFGGILDEVHSITLDPDGLLWITNWGPANDIIITERDGTLVDTWDAPPPPERMDTPEFLAFDGDGYVYITCFEWAVVEKYSTNGTFIKDWGGWGNKEGQLQRPKGIAIDDDGYVYVADQDNHRVQKFDRDGNFKRAWGGQGTGPGKFYYPSDIAIDRNGDVIVSETGNPGPYDRIQKFDRYGGFLASISHDSQGNGLASAIKGIGLTNHTIVLADDWSNKLVEIWNNLTLVPAPAVDKFNDTDADELPDDVEEAGWEIEVTNSTGTHSMNVDSDPLEADTDGDGLNDTEEYALGSDPRSIDTDGDGISDGEEHFDVGSNVTNWDSDGDGLDDGTEITYRSDPWETDTDGEGLSDLNEFILGAHPNMTDTDLDGLDDAAEDVFKSNILHPDSDGDTMFDSIESEMGTRPDDPDHDGDGLIDGHELVLLTDATNGDTDGDELSDGLEVAMRIDPLSNDTDGDGLTDKVEVDLGLNPGSSDSDGDAVPDSLDKDYEVSLDETVYVVADISNDTANLVEALADEVDIKLITAEKLLTSYKNARYIVLVGPITTETGTPGAIISDLLRDTPDVLQGMNQSQKGHIGVLYGAWAPTQTIVMVSQSYPFDHYRVLGILRSVSVKVSEGALAFTYTSPRSCFKLDDFNTIRMTDATIWTKLDDMALFSVEISKYSNDDTPQTLTLGNGLSEDEVAMGKYIQIKLSDNIQGEDQTLGTSFRVYYTSDDLDMDGNGDTTGPGDIDESTLVLYLFDDDEGRWTRLSNDMDMVTAIGVNTTDVERYGRSYAGHIWANITHLSLFGAGGMARSGIATEARPGDDMTVAVNEMVTFDGTTSEGNGEIVKFTWTFEYKERMVTLHGATPTYKFGRAGTYNVTLVVKDAFGGLGQAAIVVQVNPIIPPTITIRVGPLVDEDIKPIWNARVMITWGEETYSGFTGFSGLTDIEVSRNATGGNVTVSARGDGYEPQEYVTSILAEGELERQPSPMVASEVTEPPDKEPDGPAGWEYGIIVVLLVLVLLALMMFLGKPPSIMRKKEEKNGGKEET